MSRGISLHIGLNAVDPDAYEGWDGQLAGCVNDANSMKQIASDAGYETKQLITQKATRAAVSDAISTAAKTLGKDDIFLLTYSGHGGQVPDSNGDEPDHKDETWVLFDGELVDDQLYELYTQFKPGVRVFVLSDSCHSGTVVRAMYDRTAPIEAEFGLRPNRPFRSKLIDPATQAKVIKKHAADFQKIQDATKAAVRSTPEATVLLISGCQDNQLSSDGDVNGLFTENLIKAWNKGKFEGNYRQFAKTIKQTMPPSQQPKYFVVGAANRAFERQKPFTVNADASARRTSAA
jgi:hypothetical protein